MTTAEGLSIRELIIRVPGPQTFIGRPPTVADAIATLVSEDTGDGFILVPHVSPAGWTSSPTRSSPWQERGLFRTDYTGPTLRDHLGLPTPPAC